MENNNDVTIFNSDVFGKLRIKKINGVDTFNINDICFGLGYTSLAKGKLYLYKKRIVNICESLGIKGFDTASNLFEITKDIDFENTYINEDSFYDLCLESDAKNARIFRKWVTIDVLPSIRQNGGYIKDNATELQVDKITKYSLPKLKNTFKTENIELIHNTYQDVKEFYKYKSRDTEFRLKIMKNIEQGLKDRIENYKDHKQIAFITICDDLIKIIKEDREELRIRVSGGRMAYKTRTINKQGKLIEEQNEELCNLESKLNYYEPEDYEWIEITTHPFSHNYMTTIAEDWNTGKPKTVKSEEYRKWQNKFPYQQLPSSNELGIDFSKRVCAWFRFVAKSSFDSTNCHKTAIDTICKYYNVDDNKVELMECKKIDTCKEYWDGKIYVAFRNQ